ncbi:MAG: LmbZ [Gammaproteobacteria bacterium RIFCSPHIGHO2_12_FULL_43_28]|nr:MAG: LmbZ [Gammaproteobacteria bacterium RIFCSPHIGHO2_12_FULL_43_28]
MNVAIIGCGFIGEKRARQLGACRLVACVDKDFAKAERLASGYPDCVALTDWREAVNRPDVEMVIIAVLHSSLAEIAYAAVSAGKHVMIEKPGAKRAHELDDVIEAAEKTGALVRIGFNHRYHRALQKARELVDHNALGDLMFIRARYGHGGRLGYDKEWRADPALSGGGELIDQGVHLIDLARWFLGDFTDIEGSAHTFFWNMPVDDNGFLLLRTPKQQVAFLHASCTEWRNLFSFEIYGRNGKIDINGLGGSYGIERITYYRMLPEMGPPETYRWEYPMPDNSWEVEFNEFLEDIKLKRQPEAGLRDAQAALKIVEQIYRMSDYDYSS